MPSVAALSRHPDTATAIGEVVGAVLEQIGNEPDLAVLFLTPSHLPAVEQAGATVQTLLAPAAFIGAGARGVLAAAEAVESRPGVALWAARWPSRRERAAEIHPLHLTANRPAGEDGPWQFDGLEGAPIGAGHGLLLLTDPFTFPADEFLGLLATSAPGMPIIGGLASAAHTPTGNRLVVGGRVVRTGAVGVIVPLDLLAPAVVSQGCRPIGKPMTVTKSTNNVLYELAGRPALDAVLDLIASLEPTERALADLGLHCGIVVDDSKLDFGRGDFLIRGVLGASREHRAVVIGDHAPIGTTVQFQVRDAATAGEDLEELLGQAEANLNGALVFTCNGRGAAMFASADHDAAIVSDAVPQGVAGMFCAGEIGPIGRRNALHGFTASLALFRE